MVENPAMANQVEKVRVVVGADHAGYRLKEKIKRLLALTGYATEDVGTDSEQPVDYPDFARRAAEKVAAGEAQFAILTCGTGIGMAIAANKVPGVRAATVRDCSTARLAREHNDANVLTLGARLLTEDHAVEIVCVFLESEFAGGRHERRVEKLNALDRERAAGASN
jgi:ribose 5-phosphate isomerase B